jgi:hypothetical protein
MGITGAPTMFCEALTMRLYDFLVSYTMELFMDDGGCSTNTFEDMMNTLEAIFKCFKECKFSIAPSKTRLFITETKFAGATVGPSGVKPDLSKLTAIVDWAHQPHWSHGGRETAAISLPSNFVPGQQDLPAAESTALTPVKTPAQCGRT